MTPRSKSLRTAARLLICALALGVAGIAHAQDKLVVLTTWFAQAEHGGVYQAAVTGIYKKHGLDVTVKSGGPQVNGIQLLLAGQADFIMNYDFAVLQGVERGLPLVTVAAPFQFDLQGVLAHEDVKSLGGLKDKTILVAGTGTTYWWPWLKAKYGYTDAQMRPYTFNLQPFFADPNIAQQAFASSEPYQAAQKGVKANFLLLADDGYPPYTQAMTTTQKTVAEKPEMVARFVKATIEGWKSFMENPAPALEEIKKAKPQHDRRPDRVRHAEAARAEGGLGRRRRQVRHRHHDRRALEEDRRLHGRRGAAEADDRLQEGVHDAVRQGSEDHALRAALDDSRKIQGDGR
jgi:NitT/TauT family transport system substrate-binding protein